jgi:glycine/D-amino acid oxidase-like deaminating enzyme
MKTIVVGSGMIGASVAYHLAVRGAEVTVVTGDRPGGIATAASFAWINAAPGNSRPYFEFRLKAILDWHRLQHDLNGSLEMNCNGSLWWEEDMESVEEKAQESTSWGYGAIPWNPGIGLVGMRGNSLSASSSYVGPKGHPCIWSVLCSPVCLLDSCTWHL